MSVGVLHFIPRPKGCVEKPVIEGLDFVGTGLVELAKSRPRRGPCPNFKADSHKGCPYENHFFSTKHHETLFQQSLKVVAIN